LEALEAMGLAQTAGPDCWRVRQDFEITLRAMQRLADRQKILAAHGVPISDTRLPLVMFDPSKCETLEGRILAHGEDEGTGRMFMMLEGTDAKVYCIYHTSRMAEARGRGGLRANRFIRLRKVFTNHQPVLEIDDLGHAEQVLRNRGYQEETARSLIEDGITPADGGWGGWLGRYQAIIREVTIEMLARKERERNHSLER
jgi:hypothetical protein